MEMETDDIHHMKCMQTEAGRNFLISEGKRFKWYDIFVIRTEKAPPLTVLHEKVSLRKILREQIDGQNIKEDQTQVR